MAETRADTDWVARQYHLRVVEAQGDEIRRLRTAGDRLAESLGRLYRDGDEIVGFQHLTEILELAEAWRTARKDTPA
jgi:hypothetical protein